MKNQFSLFDLLILIGITQGIITSIFLLLSKRNSKSNRFLALAIIAFCLLSFKILLHTLGLWNTHYFRYFPIAIELALAPLLYFYIRSLIDPNFKFTWKEALHFLPFLTLQAYALFIYFNVISISTLADKDIIANSFQFNPIKKTEDYLTLISVAIYLVISYIKLKKYRAWLNDNVSDNTFPSFSWLKNIFTFSVFIGLFLLINLLLDSFFNFGKTHFFHWQLFFIFIASLIYYLGFVGYKQPNFEIKISEKPVHKKKTVKLSAEKSTMAVEKLKKVLNEDKIFLNPTLSSLELAKHLEISQSNLSYVVNSSFNKSFRDLINDYRIEEFKSKLDAPNFKHMSILGIALECGFNSEASFYRVFKKNTGMSPKEYALQLKK